MKNRHSALKNLHTAKQHGLIQDCNGNKYINTVSFGYWLKVLNTNIWINKTTFGILKYLLFLTIAVLTLIILSIKLCQTQTSWS